MTQRGRNGEPLIGVRTFGHLGDVELGRIAKALELERGSVWSVAQELARR